MIYLLQPPALHHDCAEDDFLGAAEESDDGDAPWLPGVEVVVEYASGVPLVGGNTFGKTSSRSGRSGSGSPKLPDPAST